MRRLEDRRLLDAQADQLVHVEEAAVVEVALAARQNASS